MDFELEELYDRSNIIGIIKPRRLSGLGYVHGPRIIVGWFIKSSPKQIHVTDDLLKLTISNWKVKASGRGK